MLFSFRNKCENEKQTHLQLITWQIFSVAIKKNDKVRIRTVKPLKKNKPTCFSANLFWTTGNEQNLLRQIQRYGYG